MAALSQAIEGTGFDSVTGEILPLGPTVPHRSKYAVAEIGALCEHEGMIQAPPGSHDDLAIADGGCLHLCAKFGRKLHAGGYSSGGARRDASANLGRTQKVKRRPRRKLRPE